MTATSRWESALATGGFGRGRRCQCPGAVPHVLHLQCAHRGPSAHALPQYTSVGHRIGKRPGRQGALQLLAGQGEQAILQRSHRCWPSLPWMKNMSSLESDQYTPVRPIVLQWRFPAVRFCDQRELRTALWAEQEVSQVEQPGLEMGGERLEHRRLRALQLRRRLELHRIQQSLGSGDMAPNSRITCLACPYSARPIRRDFNPAVDKYFAPAGAFVVPPTYQFGNIAPVLDWVARVVAEIGVGFPGKVVPHQREAPRAVPHGY